MTSEWFASDGSARSLEERRFAELFRQRAPELTLFGISPENTTAFLSNESSPVLIVDVPELAQRKRGLFNLQITFSDSEEQAVPELQGCWGDSYLFENFGPPFDSTSLQIIGITAAIDQWVDWALNWCVSQLSAPVVHQVLMKGTSTLAERWALIDSNVELDANGPWRHRRLLQRGQVTTSNVIRSFPH